jgi:hypothetical protein
MHETVGSNETTPLRAELTTQEQAFTASLEKLSATAPGPLPALHNQLSHSGDVFEPNAVEMQSGVYLNPDFKGETGDTPPTLTFNTQPLADLGRKIESPAGGATQTKHGTFFGSIRVENGTDQEPQDIPVAVKPIESSEFAHGDFASQEVAMLQHAKDCGLPTLEVVGVIVDNEATTPTRYVITKREDQIRSLDAMDWTEQAKDAPEHLGTAVKTMAALHGHAIFHRDLEFKNLSPLDEEGSFAVFDLEWAVSHQETMEGIAQKEDDIEPIAKAIAFDMGTVRRSLDKLVYPNLPEGSRPESPQEKFDYELNHLYEPYHTAILKSGSAHTKVLDQAYRRFLAKEHEKVRAVTAQAKGQVSSIVIS